LKYTTTVQKIATRYKTRNLKLFWGVNRLNPRSLRYAIALVVMLSPRGESLSDLVGQATIVDGDTIKIHGTLIRIFGVDAPESTKLCRRNG
jgi:endonuclease YncB( thermonuclease family)